MIDKNTIQQVLGSLMRHPQFLSHVDKYNLSIKDFSSKFEQYIFLAINNIYREAGASSIEPIDIENYLDNDATAAKIFENNNGIEYLNDIIELSNEETFPYYYTKLKKLNLLRDLKQQGINTKDFYIEDLTDPNYEKINSQFELLSTKDICDAVKKKILQLETKYAVSEEIQTYSITSNLEDIVDGIGEIQGIGPSIQGRIYNQIISGAVPGTLTIRSSGSGVGKTRNAVMDAARLCFPYCFNSSRMNWGRIGSTENILFIITEQSLDQIQRMILAYLTDINESRFKYGKFNDFEKLLIKQAVEIMKEYEQHFTVIKMPEPTIDGLKTIVRETCLTKKIDVVFFDYIFINPGLLREFRGFNLRNDELLLMMSTALKDLAVELDVPIFTSTQVNAAADDNRNIRNEASLAGGRSTINKADNGCIIARPTKEELDALRKTTDVLGVPNFVTDIYKVRSGEWTQVRIWSIIDLGTLKKKDLFITDARLDVIPNFTTIDEYEVNFCEDEESVAKRIGELNDQLSRNN